MNITELLDELRIPYVTSGHEHARDGWVQLDCPYCSPDWQHWRLGINVQYLYANCWSCGRQGLSHVLTTLSGRYQEVQKLIKQLDRQSYIPLREYKDRKLVLPKNMEELKKPHIKYLKSRGFDPDEIRTLWNVRGLGVAGSLSWRLFIPVFCHGETVSWTARSVIDQSPRYLSSKDDESKIPIKEVLYGGDYARHAIIVVEGPLDAWAIGPGAVALCGTAFKTAQVSKIAKYPIRIICFDHDAQKRARELCSLLSVLPGETTNVLLETGKDAAEANRKEIQELRSMLK